MLYTIGKRELYEEYILKDPNAAKGITGSVWKDFESVKTYRNNRAPLFGIYGVIADWDEDTKDIGGEFKALTRSAKLVFIDEETGEEQ